MTEHRRLLLVVAAVSLGITAALVITPLRFAYVAPDLRIALETTQGLIGALVAFLVYGLYRRTRLWRDLAVVYGLGVSAATNLFFALARTDADVLVDTPTRRFETWAPIVLRVASGAALAWAALAPPARARVQRAGAEVTAALVGTVAAVVAVTALLDDWLPPAVTREPGDASHPDLDGPAVLLAAQLGLVVVFALAAWGFAGRASRDAPLVRALSIGCVLAAASRLHFFLYPSLYSDVVHIGDFFRLGFYLVLLAGAAAEILRYWRAVADGAVASERRRMARELHDGLTQELSFIRSQTTSLAGGRDDPTALAHVAEAADRAVVEARRLIGVLNDDSGAGTLEHVLRRAAASVGDREGVAVEVDVAPDARIPAEWYDDLARIVAEATNNAGRHGGARNVRIAVVAGVRSDVVTIRDDGRGFDPATTNGGFGLRSMRERAEDIGGRLRLTSEPSGETCIEIEVLREL